MPPGLGGTADLPGLMGPQPGTEHGGVLDGLGRWQILAEQGLSLISQTVQHSDAKNKPGPTSQLPEPLKH